MTRDENLDVKSDRSVVAVTDEKRLMSKIWWRIVPLLFLSYLSAYLDRVNVAFAALHMNKELGFTSTQYGLGASIFFIAYFLFEVPSNLLLQKVGARHWISRIMLTWGIVSAMMALTTSPSSFYLFRFLLGAAEAGFLPGVILYLGWWFPQRYRVRAVSAFFLAMPVSSVVGGPISGLILGLDGYFGLAGWQLLFILESLLALVLGVVVFTTLPRSPETAGFLNEAEKRWLLLELASESGQEHGRDKRAFAAVLTPTVWLLAAASFGVNFAQYAFGMWLPLVVKDFGVSDSAVGWLSALPYTLGAAGMLLASCVAQERKRQIPLLYVGCAIASVSLFAVRWAHTASATLIVLCVCAVGIFVFLGTFWGTAPGVLSASTRTVGIALINSIGGLSGYCGPYALGYLKDATGNFNVSLALMGFGPVLATVALFCLTMRLSRANWAPRAVLD